MRTVRLDNHEMRALVAAQVPIELVEWTSG